MARQFFVYILSSRRRVLYVGVTNDLERRLFEHRAGLNVGFTTRYRATHLVYYETTENPLSAIAREKEIKGWRRSKKVQLVSRANPGWVDLSRDWQ
jgi:putative endonuclease